MNDNSIVILDGGRRLPRPTSWSTTTAGALRALLDHPARRVGDQGQPPRTPRIDPTLIGHVVMGLARHSHATRSTAPKECAGAGASATTVPALTVARICGSGPRRCGRPEMILAGLRHDVARPFTGRPAARREQYLSASTTTAASSEASRSRKTARSTPRRCRRDVPAGHALESWYDPSARWDGQHREEAARR